MKDFEGLMRGGKGCGRRGRGLAMLGIAALLSLPGVAPAAGPASRPADADEIQLHRRRVDTRRAAPLSSGRRLKLVQFTDSPTDDDLAVLADSGARIVDYVPRNAFLVLTDDTAAGRLASESQRRRPLKYIADYEPADAIDPRLDRIRGGRTTVDVTVQLVGFAPSLKRDLLALERWARGGVSEPEFLPDGRYANVRLNVEARRIDEIARLDSVVHIEPFLTPEAHDERQGQVLVGALDALGQTASGPGYLAWIDAQGFSQDPNDYPVVAVVDDGVDNGTAAPASPDFRVGGSQSAASRIVFSVLPPGSTGASASGPAGHGSLNASVLGGFPSSTGSMAQDAFGFRFGLGISPYGRMANVRLYSPGYDSGTGTAAMVGDYFGRGARIANNSWGVSAYGAYDTLAQMYDALARDAQSTVSGAQQILFVFSAGNNGPTAGTMSSPGVAKNVLTVGASESSNPMASLGSGCGDPSSGGDDCREMANFSSRGPCDDGRIKPDVVAPGTFIHGVAAQPDFTGAGVCGPAGNDFTAPGTDALVPAGSSYTWSSGTSHSTPAIAGVASLAGEFLGRVYGIATASPALLKAYVLHAGRQLAGAGGTDSFPSIHQGFGRPDLGVAFRTAAPRFLHDQLSVLGGPGGDAVFSGTIPNPSEPVRIALVWTDPAGPAFGNAFVNDLDLTLTSGATIYRGNNFQGEVSQPGGTSDTRNNVEAIFLPAGLSGSATIRVTAATVAGNGVPGNADPTDQDFALVAYNFVPSGAAGGIAFAKTVYGCSANAALSVQDSDRAGAGSVVAIVSGAAGDHESVTLTETAPGSGSFAATVALSATSGAIGDGVVRVADAGSVSAVYSDTGSGGLQAVAAIDCTPPAASGVGTSAIGGGQATVTVNSDEPALLTVRYGTSCSTLASSMSGSTYGNALELGLTGLAPNTLYFFAVMLTDPAGNVATNDNGGSCYSFETGDPAVYLAEMFESGFDLANRSLTYAPAPGGGYTLCQLPLTAFPTDPAGGSSLPLEDDSSVEINLIAGKRFPFFGQDYASVYVGSNGYVTFGSSDDQSGEDLAKHFAKPRVAAVFDDLDPGSGGGVSWRQLSDRVAITYQQVPEYGLGGANSFQIELFFSGMIRVTYLAMSVSDGIAGLSGGGGTPGDFSSADLSEWSACSDSMATLELDRALYDCRDVVGVRVHDGDLASLGGLPVAIGTTGGDVETVTLVESPAGSGTFEGAVQAVQGGVVTEDGQLQIDGGQRISATYLDADDGTGSSATLTASAPATCRDDYLLFTVSRTSGTPKFYKFGPMTVADGQGSAGYNVTSPSLLGVPAMRDGMSLLDGTNAYQSYKGKGADGFADVGPFEDVHVRNRCHEMYLQATRAAGVMIPAAADPNNPVSAPLPGLHDLDPMQCYKAKPQRILSSGVLAPEMPEGMQVELSDPLNGGAVRRYDLLGVARLCLPASIAGSPNYLSGPQKGQPKAVSPLLPEDSAQVMVCYRAALAKRAIPQSGCVPADPNDRGTNIDPAPPKHAGVIGIHHADAFGAMRLDTSREREICLPAVLE